MYVVVCMYVYMCVCVGGWGDVVILVYLSDVASLPNTCSISGVIHALTCFLPSSLGRCLL